MNMRRLSLLLLPVILLLASCSGGHDNAAPESPSAALDSLFEASFGPADPGCVVLVAKGDSIIYSRGFGMARLDEPSVITDTTLFNICSISKQFAAIALLKLQEQGALSLDDSVSKYFPDFKAPFFSRITLRHLLSHTSGIPDTRPRTDEEWERYVRRYPTSFDNVRDYKVYALCEESVRYMTDLDSLAFEPGTAYEYQNPTYQLVLPIVEQVTGRKFTDWMRDSIFLPAGMTSTVFVDPGIPGSDCDYAHGYIPATPSPRPDTYVSPDGRWEESDYGEAFFFPTKADGGLYTSAREFLKWECALFGGRIVGQKSLDEAFTPLIATDLPHTSYGLGFFIEDCPGVPHKIFHTGDNGGFLTFEGYFPDNQIFYLIFANRPDWQRERTAEKVDSLLIAKRWL